ncbi:LacI family DNA-binding transcriptional regulator [Enemella evansiae]|uniref:LacI family DNA-binding transcriptional regulator n=1 Tax=Enemella evansiae TaxID=2016499 RepID=UPI001E5B98B3|nr:LacI family DNA-binding transcriptional regulator [Enemella evansiae]
MSERSGGRTRPPSMMDVAALAGVSHQTVSRVFNEADSVRAATRDRVLAAVDQLGYRRNLSARALATHRSGLIGVLSGGSPLLGPASTLSAVEAAARRHGYATLVGIVGEDDPEEPVSLVDSFAARGVDGIVAIVGREAMAAPLLDLVPAIPMIVVADVGESSEQPSVVAVDHAAGARAATQHLIELGHRRIAHLAGPVDWFDARSRIRGWRSAMADAGLDGPLLEGDWTAARGHALGEQLARSGLPDAVVCGNDLIALGLIAALRERGIGVPDRVSVVGYDDMPGSAFFSPALTTVRQPFDELASACLETLVAQIGGEGPARRLIAPELRIRASTAPLA